MLGWSWDNASVQAVLSICLVAGDVETKLLSAQNRDLSKGYRVPSFAPERSLACFSCRWGLCRCNFFAFLVHFTGLARKDRLLNLCRSWLWTQKPATGRHCAYSESFFLARAPSWAEPSKPPRARQVEHGLHRQRVIRALFRAGVYGTQNSGCVASSRHRFERSIFSRSVGSLSSIPRSVSFSLRPVSPPLNERCVCWTGYQTLVIIMTIALMQPLRLAFHLIASIEHSTT